MQEPPNPQLVKASSGKLDFKSHIRMLELPAKPSGTLAFGTNPTVHHTNYFEQPGTLSFILKSLKVP